MVTGPALARRDCTDDRRERVRRHWRDDNRWGPFESRLQQPTVRVDDWSIERMHVDSPTASAYRSVSPEGFLQLGHRKDYRPALPQVQVMQAVLEPVGRPLAPEVGAGERAAAPLYVPWIGRVQKRWGRGGLLLVGDCKRAAPATRAFLAWSGDSSFCPLPQVHLAEGALEAALERGGSGDQALRSVLRAQEPGEPKRMAQG